MRNHHETPCRCRYHGRLPLTVANSFPGMFVGCVAREENGCNDRNGRDEEVQQQGARNKNWTPLKVEWGACGGEKAVTPPAGLWKLTVSPLYGFASRAFGTRLLGTFGDHAFVIISMLYLFISKRGNADRGHRDFRAMMNCHACGRQYQEDRPAPSQGRAILYSSAVMHANLM
jgi:hypothetical protein